jgi:predicted NBD/HSP70 family sugar kinase
MSASQIGNSELISQVNNRLILQAVRMMQPTYRAAVARKTGLKPATVTVIVNDLLSQHLLIEEPGEATADRWGRPPLMLAVNGDVKRILAIDLEPDRIRVALTNILVENLVYKEKPIDRFAKPETVVSRIFELCDQVLSSVKRKELLGIGVSLPGLIDLDEGVLISSTNMPQWRNVPMRALLQKKLRAPVQIERSLHLASLYEEWRNPLPPEQTRLVLSLRTGVGASLVTGGQLYVGDQGFDGEIGHTVIDFDGKPCECGSRGCLETFVSASSICQRATALIKQGRGRAIQQQLDAGEALTPELIYRLAKEGDAEASEIVRDVGKYLGIAVSNMINLLAPHEVVICGSIDLADELILGAIRAEVDRSALPRTRERTTLRLASEKDRLPVLGAAVMVAREIFALPKLSHNSDAPQSDPERLKRKHRTGAARRVNAI